MLKTFSSDKIKSTKNAIFFLLWATTHHSFIFNLRFLHELKPKDCLSICVGFSNFDSVSLY